MRLRGGEGISYRLYFIYILSGNCFIIRPLKMKVRWRDGRGRWTSCNFYKKRTAIVTTITIMANPSGDMKRLTFRHHLAFAWRTSSTRTTRLLNACSRSGRLVVASSLMWET
ncbi:hypothetical protein I7I48_09958 [Histoplasma ohiense]|nr:hypothetical protein I7I48_09958 [Histoplasma ohiense (nom. inval.)]